MDVYKAPESDVSMETKRPFRPIRGLFFGLVVFIVLAMFFARVVQPFFLSLGINIDKFYLAVEFPFSMLSIFLASRTVVKRAPGKEIVYGLAFAVILVLFFSCLLIVYGGFSVLPLWYSVAFIPSLLLAVLLGAKSVKAIKV